MIYRVAMALCAGLSLVASAPAQVIYDPDPPQAYCNPYPWLSADAAARLLSLQERACQTNIHIVATHEVSVGAAPYIGGAPAYNGVVHVLPDAGYHFRKRDLLPRNGPATQPADTNPERRGAILIIPKPKPPKSVALSDN